MIGAFIIAKINNISEYWLNLKKIIPLNFKLMKQILSIQYYEEIFEK